MFTHPVTSKKVVRLTVKTMPLLPVTLSTYTSGPRGSEDAAIKAVKANPEACVTSTCRRLRQHQLPFVTNIYTFIFSSF